MIFYKQQSQTTIQAIIEYYINKVNNEVGG